MYSDLTRLNDIYSELHASERGSPAQHLVRAFIAWSAGIPAGTQLPSERQFATDLPLSRHSVRLAVGRLLRSGLVWRQGRRLFLARDPSFAVEGQHPLLPSTGRAAVGRQIVLTVLEDQPRQLAVWQRFATQYNARRGAGRLTVCAVPRTVNSATSLQRYLAAAGCDLLHAPARLIRTLSQSNALRPLSASVAARLDDEDLLWRTVAGPSARRGLEAAVPVHVTVGLLAWNAETLSVKPKGPDVIASVAALCTAARRLPMDGVLMQAPLSTMLLTGYPPHPLSIAAALEVIGQLMELAARLGSIRGRMQNVIRGDVAGIHRFAAGDVAAIVLPSHAVLSCAPHLSFAARAISPAPLPGLCTPVDVGMVAAVENGDESGPVDDVLRALVGADAQRIVAADGLNVPVAPSAFDALPLGVDGAPLCDLSAVTADWRLPGSVEESWRYFLIQHVQPRLVAIMQGEAKPDPAGMTDIIRRAAQQYLAFTV